MPDDTGWKTETIPGFLGKSRDDMFAKYDKWYGPGNWRIRWEVVGHILDFPEIAMLYEQAYYLFLNANREILDELVRVARDVYDNDPSNVQSGRNYSHQESNLTHVQDIALRRVVARLGRTFEGSELLQIRGSRGTHPLSKTLSPGQVPFHNRSLFSYPELSGWWSLGSVESFYQSCKRLQVRKAVRNDLLDDAYTLVKDGKSLFLVEGRGNQQRNWRLVYAFTDNRKEIMSLADNDPTRSAGVVRLLSLYSETVHDPRELAEVQDALNRELQ